MKTKLNDENKSKNKIITLPNLLSLFRLLLIPAFVWLYLERENFTMTCAVLLLSGLTDIADGFIARRFNMISDVGKVLDPIADKLTQAAMLFCLLFRFPMMTVPLVLLVLKELFMGITGLLVIRKTGVVLGADWHGKVATAMLYAMMIIHVLWYDMTPALSNLLIFACTVMMAVSVVLYGLRNKRALRKTK